MATYSGSETGGRHQPANPGSGGLGPAGPVGPNPTGTPPAVGGPQGPAAPFGPNSPHPAPAPRSDAQRASDKQDAVADLLSPAERAKYIAAAGKRNAAIASAEKRAKELAAFAKLRLQGPEGIRAQQALLSRNGHAVTIDGQFGPQTQAALSAYLNEQQTKLNEPVKQAYGAANPVTIRAGTNADLGAQGHIDGYREYIENYANEQISAAMKEQQTLLAKGDAKDKDKYKALEDAQRGYKNLINALQDPVGGMDNVAIHHAFKALSGAVLDSANAKWKKAIEEDAADDSLWSKKRWLDATTEVLGDVVSPFTDFFGSSFAAGLAAFNVEGAGLGGTLQAAAGSIGNLVRIPFTDLSLGGLIAPAGSAARKAIEDTNTAAEREKLVESGDIISIGQAITDQPTDKYREKHGGIGAAPLGWTPDITIGGAHIVSGIVDLALIATKDPTILASSALHGVSAVGEVAAANAVREASPKLIADLTEQLGSHGAAVTAIEQMGRRAFADMAVNGRLLTVGIGDAVADLQRTATTIGMRAAIPGLPESVAAEAIAARAAAEGGAQAGKAAAQKVILDAFIEGKYNPHITGMRQLINAFGATGGLSIEGGALGVGRKAIAMTDRLTFVRALAAPKGATASAFEHESTDFISRAVETASDAAGATWRTVWHDTVKDAVHGIDIGGDTGRFYRLVDSIQEIDNPALQAAFEGVVRPFMANPDLLKKIALPSYLEAVFQQEGLEESIRKLEVAVAVMSGSAGPQAAEQFAADLARGYLIDPNFDRKLTAQAAKNIGLSLGSSSGHTATREAIEKAIAELPEELRSTFEDRLAGLGKAKNKSGLGTLARDINLATYNSDLQEEMLRLLDQVKGRQALAERAVGSKGQLGGGLARRVLDVAEIVPPTELRFKYKTDNEAVHASLRSDAVARFLNAFHVPAVVENRLVLEAANVKTEEEMFKVAERSMLAVMEAKGIEHPNVVLDILRERGNFAKVTQLRPIRSVDELGNPVDDLQALSQRLEHQRLPKPTDLAAAVRKAILDGTEDATLAQKLASRLKVEFDKIGTISIHITRVDGTTQTLKGAVTSIHRLWKLLIVTNAGLPIVGAVAGFVGTKGDFYDKLKGAGLGFAVGSLGGTRYLMRVVGIEDRTRMFLEDGFNADTMIPGWAKMRARRYDDPLRQTLSEDITRIGNYGVAHFENDVLVHLDPDWAIIPRDHSRAPDAWYRIVNHQIHPETDPVMATLLREQAGHIDTAEANAIIKDFFTTEEGALWRDRWKGALNGTSKTKDAVERMRGFLERYSNEDLAAMRVAGGVEGRAGIVDRATFKRLLKSGLGPDEFHAQQVWKLPKNAQQLFRSGSEVVSRTILSGPANFFNRGPWHNSLFAKEYDRLVLAGVDRAEARSIADDFAQRKVNSVLDSNENSRFAAKVDIFAPFQHAREDTLASYIKLAIANPGRTMRVGEALARAFNYGKDQGIFTKNEFTGQWQITIPGSGRLSTSLFGMTTPMDFDANIKDMFFVGQGAYGVGVLPQPGGPFWSVFSRELANHYPEVFTDKKAGGLQEWFFGYGPQGNLMRSDTSRLWMAFTGDTPPWEFDNQADWKNQLNRWQHEVGEELIYQNRVKGGNPDYIPSKDEVDEAVGKFFKAWAFFGTTFPASSFPVLTTRSNYFAASNAYHAGGLLPYDPKGFLAAHPEYEAYMADGTITKYTGPDDLATLKRLRVGNRPDSLSMFNAETGVWEFPKGSAGEQAELENTSLNQKLGYREYESWAEFKDQFKMYKRTSDYYRELGNARDIKDLADRERQIVATNQKYADVVNEQGRDYSIKKEIHAILRDYPKQMRDSALQRVRVTYGMSNVDLRKSIHSAQLDPTWQANAWVGARTGLEIDAEIRHRIGNASAGGEVERYVARLRPAEQANYWNYQRNATGFDPELDDPTSVLTRYKYYNTQYYAVGESHPALYRKDSTWTNPFTKYVKTLKDDTYKSVSAAYDAASRLKLEIDAAAVAKNWTAYDALREKQSDIYDYASALRDSFLGKLPDLTKYYDDLHAATLYDSVGNNAAADDSRRMALMDKAGAPYVLTSAQTQFLYMPPSVQRAYVTNLTESLDMPAGKMPYDISQYVKETTGLKKLFWEYLTPVQQDILTAQFPNQIDAWKYQSDFYLHGAGKASKANHFKGATLSAIPSELKYAHALLGFHDKRGGKSAPKGYAEYLRLPPHAAVKAEFLQRHQDVRDWLQQGPLANMDPHMRDFVANTLVKYGNFSGGGHGGSRSWYGVHPAGKGFNGDPGPKGSGYADFKWAKYQLYAWSRRDDATKPSTYDLWVNMPSGRDKKLYLEQHPEISQWIRLGAMANMPEDYRNVVRDILQQYGDWTADQDPLGKTIQQFYSTPGYGRDQFLLNHPELEAYWAVTRTPSEQAMFDLSNEYFQIPDIAAKRAFMGSHPELQQHFLDSRSRRYEKFLNQVSAYMGANPTTFTDYLDRQQDVLAELLRRYADPPMIREAGPTSIQASTSTEGGRTRRPNSRAAA